MQQSLTDDEKRESRSPVALRARGEARRLVDVTKGERDSAS